MSQLAREIGISRPLLHLQKPESAGLVSSRLELPADGKALNYFEVTRFAIDITPATITKAAATLPEPSAESEELRQQDRRPLGHQPPALTLNRIRSSRCPLTSSRVR